MKNFIILAITLFCCFDRFATGSALTCEMLDRQLPLGASGRVMSMRDQIGLIALNALSVDGQVALGRSSLFYNGLRALAERCKQTPLSNDEKRLLDQFIATCEKADKFWSWHVGMTQEEARGQSAGYRGMMLDLLHQELSLLPGMTPAHFEWIQDHKSEPKVLRELGELIAAYRWGDDEVVDQIFAYLSAKLQADQG